MSVLLTGDSLVLAVGVLCLSATLLVVAYPDRYVRTRPLNGIPGPRGAPLIGNFVQALQWQGRSLGWLKHLSDTYGPLCTFTLPIYGRGILIERPEWIAHVRQHDMQKYAHGANEIALMTEFPGRRAPIASVGAEWRLSRKAILPIFTTKAFTDHVSQAINRVIPNTRRLLQDVSKNGSVIDWNDLAGRITLSIFTISSMNFDSGIIRPTIECLDNIDPLFEAIAVLNHISSRRLMNPLWRVTEVFTGDRSRFNRARTHVQSLVDTIIRTRRTQLSEKPDEFSSDWLSKLLRDATFDDPVLLRDILVVLLFAGADNTQNAFAWSLYCLTSASGWAQKMRLEAMKNQNAEEGVRYGDLGLYHVHLAVFYETIRLWPGIPKNGRVALFDDVLPAIPAQGLPSVEIQKDDFIFWSDYHVMRDETVWGPDANEFNPGRHLDAEGHFVRPTAPRFIGFGGPGPRLCPAMQLVTYEFVACWAGILPYFDFERLTHDPHSGREIEEPAIAEAFTPSMAGPFKIRVKTRGINFEDATVIPEVV
ncbi:cytochrome P450 [Trametes meyenii]|nr:cytochrome P450 [Trametes meyenii]